MRFQRCRRNGETTLTNLGEFYSPISIGRRRIATFETMGVKKYRGPVENVEQAMQAGDVLEVTCQTCSRSRTMWAWRIYTWRKKDAARIPLNKPTGGFFCEGCRANTMVILRRAGPWLL